MSNHQMPNHPTKPGGKSSPRARKLDPPRRQKADQAPGPNPAQQPDVKTPIEAAIAAPDPLPIPAVASATAPSAEPPAATPSIDLQTIATAYSDYTRKSFEQTKSFVEKLSGVRSLDKAIEVQTEFARQAYETFVTESQKIRGFYSGLARQNFERTFAKVIPAAH